MTTKDVETDTKRKRSTQTDRHKNTQRQIDRQTYRHKHRQTVKTWTDRHRKKDCLDRQSDRQTIFFSNR